MVFNKIISHCKSQTGYHVAERCRCLYFLLIVLFVIFMAIGISKGTNAAH